MFSAIDRIIASQHLSGEAFFVTEVQGTSSINRVLLEPAAEAAMTAAFSDKLSNIVITPNTGKTSVPLVSALIERDKQVFEYDHQTINHLPAEFALMRSVLSFGVQGNPPPFDFSTQQLSTVKGLIYLLSDGAGSSVILYQHKYPVSLHKKTKRSYLSINGRTLDKVSYDSIDINDTIDFFFFSGKFYALNIALLERFYGLERVIDNLANAATPLILNLNIININGLANPTDIFKDMYKDRAFMRRLAMVAQSTLIQRGLTINQILLVTNDFPIFSRTIDLTGGLVNLTTKEQKRNFIRLLNNEASFAALDHAPFLAVDKDSAA